jgi:hypothetical protein
MTTDQPSYQPRMRQRSGWRKACPLCGALIAFTTLHLHDGPTPFFFSDRANEVLLRRSDEETARQAWEAGRTDTESLRQLWEAIVEDAPSPPSGGRYALWANFRCPTCRREIPYDDGRRNAEVRIHEHVVVLPDGATIIGDREADTWRVQVVT